MLDSLAWQRILMNGTVISLLIGIFVLGSLKYNARLWLQDYPKPIRDKVAPLSATEKRERVIVSALVLGVLFGGIIVATLQLRNVQAGAFSFGTAYLHIFLMLVMFNLFDAVVLDLIILTWLTPRFVIIPGTEGMEVLFRDYRKHLMDFLKGMVFCATISLPFAVIAIL